MLSRIIMHNLEQISTLTQALIKCRSIAGNPDQIKACFDLIENELGDLKSQGWTFDHQNINGHTSLIVTHGTKSPKVMLCGHIDVVDGRDEQFVPKIIDSRLYGRGALDMKSGVAVLTHIMKEAADKNQNIGLMITSDEETGGFDGTQALLKNGYSCQVAILPDGGMAVNRIVHKAKGVLWVELAASGKSAHGSVPWQGDNAIQKLMKAVDSIQSLFPAIETHDEDHWAATCNLGQIEGGSGTNQVPAVAKARCDIRYTEHDTPENLMERLKNSLSDGVTINQLVTASTTYTSPENPFLQLFMQAVREQGREPEIVVDHGSSDARYFSELNIPVIVCQPDGQGHHGQDEWVDIKGISDYYATVKSFLEKI